MKFSFTFILFSLFINILFAQNPLNMELVAHVDYPENCNDIWGYVADDGHEYAVLGTTQATAIHDLADPTNPVEIAYIEGATSTWRDMKQWGHYAYIVADVGTDGLLVVDMSMAPDSVSWVFWKPEITVGGFPTTLEKCHNIYIDEDGFAYLAGCNMNSGGPIIFDLKTDDGIPVYVGATEPIYAHDVYAQNDTLYTSDIYAGTFSVIDVNDRSNPITLATQTTTSNFTHNAWTSTDGRYLFTTDERPNAYVDAYDISDLTDIKRLDTYQPADTRGLGVIPHNVHYMEGGYLVISWYTDGVKIVDANRPDNLVEVGSYDTYDGPHGGFNGCWGVTPFLPSGLVLAADINTGLYVFEANYQRACYLEGTVRSAGTGVLLNEVTVTVDSDEYANTTTDISGVFKTGQATAGTVDVTFSKPGYYDQTVSVVLENGEITMLDIELEAFPSALVTGTTLRDDNDEPIANAKVLLVSEIATFEAETDENGNFSIAEVFYGDYAMYAGAWGYQNYYFDNISIDGDGTYAIRLQAGYQDDFVLDLGWTTYAEASSGLWERAIPNGTIFQSVASHPFDDVSGDLGESCYSTGNLGGGAGDDDVDNGFVELTSPIMDLTGYNEPIISYHLWFFNTGGSGAPNDSLVVRLNNGIDTITIEKLEAAQSGNTWRPASEIKVSDYIEVTETMQLTVTVSDFDPGHLVEGAFDAFLVSEGEPTSTTTILNKSWQIQAFPNPFSHQVAIQYQVDTEGAVLEVYNLLGQKVNTYSLENTAGTIHLGGELPTGMYFVNIQTPEAHSATLKVVKE